MPKPKFPQQYCHVHGPKTSMRLWSYMTEGVPFGLMQQLSNISKKKCPGLCRR
jgi:hypothetical protein